MTKEEGRENHFLAKFLKIYQKLEVSVIFGILKFGSVKIGNFLSKNGGAVTHPKSIKIISEARVRVILIVFFTKNTNF